MSNRRRRGPKQHPLRPLMPQHADYDNIYLKQNKERQERHTSKRWKCVGLGPATPVHLRTHTRYKEKGPPAGGFSRFYINYGSETEMREEFVKLKQFCIVVELFHASTVIDRYDQILDKVLDQKSFEEIGKTVYQP